MLPRLLHNTNIDGYDQDSHLECKLWELIPCSDDCRALDSRWVFRCKIEVGVTRPTIGTTGRRSVRVFRTVDGWTYDLIAH
jgi:hypothetical protein